MQPPMPQRPRSRKLTFDVIGLFLCNSPPEQAFVARAVGRGELREHPGFFVRRSETRGRGGQISRTVYLPAYGFGVSDYTEMSFGSCHCDCVSSKSAVMSW